VLGSAPRVRAHTARLPLLGIDSVEGLRKIADGLPDGLFVTDSKGNVTTLTSAAERITGWSRGEGPGEG